MRLLAGVLAAVAVVLALAACGGSGAGDDASRVVTVNLPTYADASSPIAHLAAPGRRINGHPAAAQAAAAGSSASTPTSVQAAIQALDITPLTPRADARLNGVSVWVPYWGVSAAVASAIDNAKVVKVAHPFLYQIEGTSTVDDESGGQAATVSHELSAAGIDVIPTVTETDQMGAFAAVLANRNKQDALLTALEGIAEAPGNSGIDLDFENLAIGSNNAKQVSQVETLYPQMVAKLCQALHRTNRSCEVTVMAKNTPGIADGDGLNTFVYDYAALGAVADRVQIMAYDDHTPSGAAGPIAPWPWVQSVLGYATSQISPSKLVLGIPAYGYEWASNNQNSSLTATAAEALAAQQHAQIDWNAADAEPYFSYDTSHTTTKVVIQHLTKRVKKLTAVMVAGQKQTKQRVLVEHTTKRIVQRTKHITSHLVWFENSTADYDRAVLAADDKLAGVAIWAGGDESPGLWPMLARLK